MVATFLLGRLVFGGFFLMNGLNLLLAHPAATQLAPEMFPVREKEVV